MAEQYDTKREKYEEESSDMVLTWDVIADEILPRIPRGTLALCKSVCKQWNAHISGPDFIPTLSPVFRCHSGAGGGKPMTELHLSLRAGGRFGNVDHRPNFHRGIFLWPLSSCNGLSCFASNVISSGYEWYYIIWNPSRPRNFLRFKMAYRPSLRDSGEPLSFAGFGFDASAAGEYKVVEITYRAGAGDRVIVDVFSISRRRWKPCSDAGPLPNDIVEINWRWPQTSHDGRRSHWLAKRGQGGATRLVVSFDFQTESLSHVSLPESLAAVTGRDGTSVALAVFPTGNWLTVVEYCRGACAVWVMKGSDWVVAARIALEPPGRVLGFVKRQRVLIIQSGKVMSYDTMTGERVCLEISDAEVFRCVSNDYVESMSLEFTEEDCLFA